MHNKIMKNITIPQLPLFPLINRWIQADLNKVETLEQAVDFIHKWTNEMEATKNPIKKTAIQAIVNYMYSQITNKSYQSKLSV